MSGFRPNQTSNLAALIVYAVTTVGLSGVALLCWKNQSAPEEALPLILLFAIVFAYRFYLHLQYRRKVLRRPLTER